MSGRWPEEKKTPPAKLRGRLTIEKAAVAMDITGRTLSRYENGTADVPMKVVDKMVKLYQVSIERIYHALQETWVKSVAHVDESVNQTAQVEQVSTPYSQHYIHQPREGYVTLEEAARRMNMSPSVVEYWCQLRIFENAYMAGGDWFIPADEIEEAKRRIAEQVATEQSDAIREAQVAEEPQSSQDTGVIPAGYLALEEAAKQLKMLSIHLGDLCQRGLVPNARKSGEDWLIPKEAMQIVENMSDAVKAGG